MRRSLFDRVDLAAVRAAAEQLPGLASVVVACLSSGGVLQFDRDDPEWPDRDRLIVGTTVAAPTVRAAFEDGTHATATAWETLPSSAALARSVELAIQSAAAGDPYRVYCLLDATVYGQGAAWEAAVDAGRRRLPALTVVVVGRDTRPVEAMFRAAGWHAFTVDGGDVVGVLGALDRTSTARTAPMAVLLT